MELTDYKNTVEDINCRHRPYSAQQLWTLKHFWWQWLWQRQSMLLLHMHMTQLF